MREREDEDVRSVAVAYHRFVNFLFKVSLLYIKSRNRNLYVFVFGVFLFLAQPLIFFIYN